MTPTRIVVLAVLAAGCGDVADPAVEASETASSAVLPELRLTVDQAEALLWPRSARPAWRDPTEAEAEVVRALVPALLEASTTGRVDDGLPSLAASAELTIERWWVDGRSALVLREPDGHRRGAGAYLFAEDVPSSDPWTLLEAPHAWFDLGTDELASRLFFVAPDRPAALFTNSVHRYTRPDGTRARSGDSPADACHDARHLLAVATGAAVAARHGATVVQLHGFAFDGAQDPPRGTVAVVATDGEDAPDVAAAVRARLAERLGDGVVLARDVGVLEARTNVEAALVRGVPGARFVHVELSKAVRERLVASTAESLALGVGLLDVARR